MLLRVESWAIVSWCLWLGASPVAVDGDMGTAVAVGHLGTICGCALHSADPVHPRTHTGQSAVLARGAPRTPPTCPSFLSFVTELLGPRFSPMNAQFPEVLLQPLSGVGMGGRDRARTGSGVHPLSCSSAGRGWKCWSGAELGGPQVHVWGSQTHPAEHQRSGLQRRGRLQRGRGSCMKSRSLHVSPCSSRE